MKRNLLIGSHAYRVARMEFGIVDGVLRSTNEIIVNTHKGMDRADETLFHEVFHAVEHELVLAGLLPHMSEEAYVEPMARLLFDTLKRNGLLRLDMEWDQLEIDYLEPPKETK